MAEDEVVGEIETDKVSAKFKLHLKYNPTISYGIFKLEISTHFDSSVHVFFPFILFLLLNDL